MLTCVPATAAMEEIVILDEQKRRHPLEDVQVLDLPELQQMQATIKEVYVDQAVAEYIVRLVHATREHPDVYLGASPRGSLNLYRSSQAFAALAGATTSSPTTSSSWRWPSWRTASS